jgi:branched-chain amino acid transport system substrate-binding protein
MGILLLTACGGQQSLTGSVVASDSFDVALVLPLTGKAAQVGHDFLRAVELKHKELNSTVVLHIDDTRTIPAEAITITRRILDTQDIDLIVALQAQVSMPLLAVADQYDIPLLSTLTTLPASEFSRRSDNAFLVWPIPEDQLEKTAQFMKARNYTTAATLTVFDEFGNTMATMLESYFDGEIIQEEVFEIAELDYRTSLMKIRELNPDVLYVIGYPPHLINILRQRKELGMTHIPVVSTIHIQSDFVKQEAGLDLFEDVFAVVPIAFINNNQDNFFDRYRTTFDVEPDFLAPFGHDVMLILDELSKEPKNLKETIFALDFEGMNGQMTFNKHGEVRMPLVIADAKDNSVVYT